MSTTPTCWAVVALVVEVSAAWAGFGGALAEPLPWPDTTLVPPPVAALMPRPTATAAAVLPSASAAIVPRRRRLGGCGGGGYQYGPGHGGWFGLMGGCSIVINSTG